MVFFADPLNVFAYQKAKVMGPVLDWSATNALLHNAWLKRWSLVDRPADSRRGGGSPPAGNHPRPGPGARDRRGDRDGEHGQVRPDATGAGGPDDPADVARRLPDALPDPRRPGLDLRRRADGDPGAAGGDPAGDGAGPAALRPVRGLPLAGDPRRPRAVPPDQPARDRRDPEPAAEHDRAGRRGDGAGGRPRRRARAGLRRSARTPRGHAGHAGGALRRLDARSSGWRCCSSCCSPSSSTGCRPPADRASGG